MGNKIQIKRGLKEDIPNLDNGEFGLCIDSGDLLIGNGGTNLNLITEMNLPILNINFFEGENKEKKLINMITYASNNGYKKVIIPCGIYKFTDYTDTIELPLSNYQIIIEGENPRGVVFDYSNSHIDKTFLKVVGVSGTINQSYIKNITFYGNSTTTALEINNACGFRPINCNFEDNKLGLLYHNTGDGFTELCVAQRCNFSSKCLRAVEYLNEGTQESFHGSGLLDCYINQSEVDSSVVIGANCFVYNAPLDFRAWTRGTKPLIVNKGRKVNNFYGNISIECFNNSEVNLVDTANNVVYLNGTLSTNNEKIKAIHLTQCSRIQLNNDMSINTVKLPQNNSKFCTTSTPIVEMEDTETYLIDLHFTGSNYEVQHTIIVTTFVGGASGVVNIIGNNREFDNVSLGIPSYRVANRILWVDNTNFTDEKVAVQYTCTQIGGRSQYHIR